jgi:sigma-B regulation protein RsbU (phosphoserine phosphatase)
MDDADSREVAAVHPQRTDVIHARKLQEKLLQHVPQVPGIRFATRFEACDEITGDFYVFVHLPDGRVGFALGDVSGHGVQAGLIMSMAKKTLEIYAGQGLGPAETLARVNDALVHDLGGKMFISMVYAVLDPDTRQITWARAGHNPSLYFNPISDVEGEIKPKGMVVGMKAGALFRTSLEEYISPLETGDMFLLYTDGITETMNLQQEEFGEDRLKELLRTYAADGPDVLIDRVMERLRHFRGPQAPADDATMVALLIE